MLFQMCYLRFSSARPQHFDVFSLLTQLHGIRLRGLKVWTTVVAVMKPKLEKAIEKSKKKKALKVGKKGTEGQNPSQNGCGTTAMAMSAVLAVAGFALYAAQDF
mmetsp:Transcript_2414/g.4555  ORF Transcript_2414/g.4555 Transcript_2414/m.4555 type:complete len:104 (-) Transcript_2414:182-493(-)